MPGIVSIRETAGVSEISNPHLREIQTLAGQDVEIARLLQYAILGSMSQGIGHELVNCLKGIEGYIKLALKSTLLPPKTKLFLERSLECCEVGQRFNAVSLNLFGDEPGHDSPTDPLEQILIDVARFCDGVFGPYCSVQFLISGSLPETTIPANPLKQILFNLCAAAREAIRGQGQIILSVFESSSKSTTDSSTCIVQIQARPARGPHRPSRTDSQSFPEPGFVIPFSWFSSLCRFLAEIQARRYGMELVCHLDKPEGICFSLKMPVLTRVPSSDYTNSQPSAVSKPLRLILLEDQELIADFLKTLLETKGHQVKVFHHGGELADALRTTLDPATVDVFLLDVCVPGCSGLEIGLLTRELTPHSRLVFYSAIHGETDVEEVFVLDERTKFLKKPFKINDLLLVIDQVMNARIGL